MSNFDNLPKVEFANLNSAEIINNIITGFERAEQLAGTANYRLFPGDPRRLFLQSIGYYLVLQNNVINESGKQNILPFSRGGFLDMLGALYGERGRRLAATYAVTTLEFSLSVPLAVNTIIPTGTRVSPGGNIYFATDELLVIEAGQTTATVSATCTVIGAAGNGLIPGQISTIVDRNNPFVQSAQNITESAMGSDVESDDHYRERLYLVLESVSTAGTSEGYQFWAMTASSEIINVLVYTPEPDLRASSPFSDFLAGYGIADAEAFWTGLQNWLRADGTGPGHVNVMPLMAGGNLPTQDILDAVYAACNDKKRRPLTDYLHVKAPTVVEYDISLTYYIWRHDAPSANTISANVQRAVDDFVLWQKSAIERDINPDELIQRIKNAGAKRVPITSPAFQVLSQGEVAVARNISVQFGGLEDD